MKLLKDWYSETASGYETERDAIGTLKAWVDKGNLRLDHGSGHTVEEIYGLPYTSTSDFAAIWNVQAKAHYRNNPQMEFDGVALRKDRVFIAVFTVYDLEGNEVGTAYVEMN